MTEPELGARLRLTPNRGSVDRAWIKLQTERERESTCYLENPIRCKLPAIHSYSKLAPTQVSNQTHNGFPIIRSNGLISLHLGNDIRLSSRQSPFCSALFLPHCHLSFPLLVIV